MICASNENNILTDFINTGVYDLNREFIKTISPSMDILISSNLERLLFHLADNDAKKVNKLMTNLKDNGIYEIDNKMKENLNDFKSYYCNESNTKETIKNVFEENNYLIDPHTAVAYYVCEKYQNENNCNNKALIVSTASPYKFPISVAKSLEIYEKIDDYKLLKKISSYTNTKIPNNIISIENDEIIHNKNILIDEMKKNILDSLNI